ncbi:MAG TPA: protein translocase subunit SecF [Terriglobia bacterium]|nr:protein translocase subunit SecF [Terriglobia bacterium]
MVELFKNIQVDWLGKRKVFFTISAALLLLGMAAIVANKGFRYGVDFKGGTIARVRFTDPVTVDTLRQTLPGSQIMEMKSGANEMQIQLEDESGDAGLGRETIDKALKDKFGSKFEILSADSVGPRVGARFRQQAVMVTLYALAGMLVYIGFRFELIFGAAAVFAVFHDTLITLGFFSLFGYEINLTVIAALLTLVGYSVNDTIVVFDRVRENLKTRRRDDLADVMNDSINQTMSRTILTSGLTFLTVLALFIFGGEIINNFAFAMVVGIIVGTYSSIAVASPLVLIYTRLRGKPMASQPVRAGAPRPAKAR